MKERHRDWLLAGGIVAGLQLLAVAYFSMYSGTTTEGLAYNLALVPSLPGFMVVVIVVVLVGGSAHSIGLVGFGVAIALSWLFYTYILQGIILWRREWKKGKSVR